MASLVFEVYIFSLDLNSLHTSLTMIFAHCTSADGSVVLILLCAAKLSGSPSSPVTGQTSLTRSFRTPADVYSFKRLMLLYLVKCCDQARARRPATAHADPDTVIVSGTHRGTQPADSRLECELAMCTMLAPYIHLKLEISIHVLAIHVSLTHGVGHSVCLTPPSLTLQRDRSPFPRPRFPSREHACTPPQDCSQQPQPSTH